MLTSTVFIYIKSIGPAVKRTVRKFVGGSDPSLFFRGAIMEIFIWDKCCDIDKRRWDCKEMGTPFTCTQEEDELLVRMYLRIGTSLAAMEIEYKKQLKNPVSWQSKLWGEYLPRIEADRVTEILKEELDLRQEIRTSINTYYINSSGVDPIKHEGYNITDYLGKSTPDPEEVYTPGTQAVIDKFYWKDNGKYVLMDEDQTTVRTDLVNQVKQILNFDKSKLVEKSLHSNPDNGTKKNVKDVQMWGMEDAFKLISKASSEAEGWMKSTKAMFVGNGSLVQVTTQQRNPDGSYAVAEALTYVPGVTWYDHPEGYRFLAPVPDTYKDLRKLSLEESFDAVAMMDALDRSGKLDPSRPNMAMTRGELLANYLNNHARVVVLKNDPDFAKPDPELMGAAKQILEQSSEEVRVIAADVLSEKRKDKYDFNFPEELMQRIKDYIDGKYPPKEENNDSTAEKPENDEIL